VIVIGSLYHELPLPEQAKTRLTSATDFRNKKAQFDQWSSLVANILTYADAQRFHAVASGY